MKRCHRLVLEEFSRLLTAAGKEPFAFQKQTWRAYLQGEDGLVHAPPGTGKTLAALLGPVIDGSSSGAAPATQAPSPLQLVWITPLRALATDLERSICDLLADLRIPWRAEKRTGDSTSAQRTRQRARLPEILITTPESLSVMLSWPDWSKHFASLRAIVVDEWHELLGTKRGVQAELAIARLKGIVPSLRLWGLSATIGDLDGAMQTLLVGTPLPKRRRIDAKQSKKIEIDSIIPQQIERFPWAGHLGVRLAREVIPIIERSQTTLVFTNTRSQTELWYQALLAELPALAGQMAVHHGSIDRSLRGWIEENLQSGKLKCCVCTSSLDLGVDFSAVDHVIQVGSPKGVARLLQRAGRSGHAPGQTSHLTFVPTNVLELVELTAVKLGIEKGWLEDRCPIDKPLDVLAQHLVTVALGGGFEPAALLAEVRRTAAYQHLSDEEWKWVLDFCQHGGSSLAAYPDYHRLVWDGLRYTVSSSRIARRHRLSIGTIVADAMIAVRYRKGGQVGMVEESFVGKMKPGDRFMLAGKILELVKVHDNTAWVKKSRGTTTTVPQWMGGRLPLSSQMSRALRSLFHDARDGTLASAEMEALAPIFEVQREWSIIPGAQQFLIERLRSRDGYHLFFYPFDGRLVHEGLAVLFAYRMSRLEPISFSMAMNDYGFVLVSPTPPPLEKAIESGLLEAGPLTDDVLHSLSTSQMCRRQFREVARIAGLLFEGYPGARQPSRHLQASSNLFFDVFEKYDPGNLLLLQAQREVLQSQLEIQRMRQVLERLSTSQIVILELPRATPLAFGLLVDKMRDRVSSEKLADRVRRMQQPLQRAAEKIEGS